MLEDLLLFAAGCACAGLGGELFVLSLVGLAERARVPKGVAAATLGAFGTSSPELIVGITAASQGVPEIAFGDALGSNIVNVALVLAIPLMIFGLAAPRDSVFRDLPVALAIFPIIGLAGLDGTISGSEALILLAIFAGWLVSVVVFALRNRTAAPATQAGGVAFQSTAGIVGLATLFLAGQLIVAGATGMATALGLHAFLIGALVVALGTSVPELATVVIATFRGHQEVGLQTILGSNIFNCLLIVSTAALIDPIAVEWKEALPALTAGFLVTLLTMPLFSLRLGRWRGIALMLGYLAFLAVSVGFALGPPAP
jgi:cation:H+ antiporter